MPSTPQPDTRSPAAAPPPLSRMRTAEDLEAVVGRPASMVMMKQLDRLDDGCMTAIAHAPLAGFGYEDAAGERRATFVGGAPGFASVDSPTRIRLFPSAVELREQPVVGSGASLVFLLPGVGETLRLNGTLAAPDSDALVIDVQEAYVHCARSILRSRLWQPPAVTSLTAAAAGAADEAEAPLRRPGVARFLREAPFLVLSTGDTVGGSDTSPRGDQPGFARVLDENTLVIPDRKGNRRTDTFHNVLRDERVALAALVPGRTEVLHLHGTAFITNDAAFLETMALRGTPPHAALVITVHDASLWPSAALERARPWSADGHVDRTAVPDLMVLASQHAAANPTKVTGGPPAFVAKPFAAFPHLTRWLMDLGYHKALKKEGYGDMARRPGALRLLRRLVPHSPGLHNAAETDPRSTRPGTVRRQMRVVALRQETSNAQTVTVEDKAEPGQPVHFQPGQFFTLITTLVGRTVRRAWRC